MSEFGWTRLAYLTVILTVFALLVKLGTFGVSSIPQNFPESVFAFSQNETPAENQYRDNDGETHDEDEHSDEHSDEHDDHEDRGHSHEPVESLYENVNFEEDAPVFYRPGPQVSSASRNPSSSGAARSCQTVGDAPPGSEIIFPMTREHFNSYEDTWGAARPQGGHEGTDLMAPNGTPLLAMTDGRIVPVAGANVNGWNTLGGYTVMLEAAYSVGPVKKGDLFYYAHMDRSSDLRIGDTVEAGDVVGFAGDTGQGPEGARGQFPPHLHLGWYETSGERTQLASGAMNPFPLLEWVKANGGSVEGGSDIPYCEAPQSSAPTPSGGGYWQFPSDPGVRPDMATGTGTAAPSPIIEQNDSSELSPDITREPRRPADPPRPVNPAPTTENDEATGPTTPEPTSGTPPPSRVPSLPSIPNPLPGIGDGIRDVIDGILTPRPPEPPEEPTGETTEPTKPATPSTPPEGAETPGEPPTESTSPEDSEDSEGTTPEETTPESTTPDDADEGTVPEGTVPEGTTPDAPPNDEAADEEDDECESHEHGDEEETTDGEPREHGDEECSEETNVEDEDSPPEEETTEPDTSEAVGDQYEDRQSEAASGP